MRKHSVLGLCFVLIALANCGNDASSPSGQSFLEFDISGVVTDSGIPISGAKVQIDRGSDMTTETDYNGYFLVEHVPAGTHLVYVSSSAGDANGSDEDPIERIYRVSVEDDVYLPHLQLPVPVILYEPSVEHGTVSLEWTASRNAGFREYKIYRGNSPGLDETVGLLVNVATERADTTFTEIEPLHAGTYYYRVFVMNDYGNIGGSNVGSATVPATRLIVTINYTGSGVVDALHPLNFGLSDGTAWPDFQDQGRLGSNNGTYAYTFDTTWYPRVFDENTFGPYYLASYFDIAGLNLQRSGILPPRSPWVIYNGVDPEDPSRGELATPVFMTRAEDTYITVTYGDEYLVPESEPGIAE